jgi:hypothetical protein
MVLMQTPWARISRDLAAQLAQEKQTLRKISSAAGVDYYAVRRMKRGGLKRRTKNAIRLCSYFGISANIPAARLSNYEAIVGEVKAAWDGSDAHAQLLVELIRSTRNFKVSPAKPDTINRMPRKTAGGARK